ncbi:hypothetical protein DENIS_0206 [Desulfonema ishimotonii]|uniref:Lipoprotein n=1 Tax=Desulfonema ishimotonii TaxID=45657 RepID=A0A401FQN3_9BACT|nr:hypothetical protein [Desulfonema ishimotonii]GBC59270.1 hypothetical protein DENIS_0206 [Desulfonema ishimotonii]
MKKFCLMMFLFLTAGCSSTGYGPYNGHSGYSDLKTDAGVYEVEYVENGMSEIESKKKALVRAAEIGFSSGYLYFDVLEERSELLKDRKFVEGKTEIRKSKDENGVKKTEIKESPSHFEDVIKIKTWMKVRFSNRGGKMSVREYRNIGIASGYIKVGN